jgi:hypothetical protein
MSARRQPERVEQGQIVALLQQLGATVYVLGTVRPRAVPCRRCGAPSPRIDFSTRQTPGLADLEAFLPAREGRPPRLLKVEVKAAAGRLSPEQRAYRDQCRLAGIAHVHGTLDAVIAWLHGAGYVRSGQVPHYRLPAESRPASAQEK